MSVDAHGYPRIHCNPETHMYVNSVFSELQREHVPVGLGFLICISPGVFTVKPAVCGILGDLP